MTNIFAQQVTSLINLDVDGLTNEKAMTRFSKRNQLDTKRTRRFYIEVSSPVQGVCHTLKRIGGRWWPKKVKNHNIIKQSRIFSHFLSNFCSYCVISCTEDRHYCQIFAPKFFGNCYVCDRANSDSTRIFL